VTAGGTLEQRALQPPFGRDDHYRHGRYPRERAHRSWLPVLLDTLPCISMTMALGFAQTDRSPRPVFTRSDPFQDRNSSPFLPEQC